jgi:hypothetical protein
MTNIHVKVDGTLATASATGKLTSGCVGLPVSFEFDASWSGLKKAASFKVGSLVRTRYNIEESTTVPWEVMRNSGKPLEIGVEGRDENGNVVIPTVWASVSTILPGATAETPAAPNPDKEDYPGGGEGANGTTFYPAVSVDGIISWTNDGGKQNPEPVDLKAAVIAALPVYNGEVEAI